MILSKLFPHLRPRAQKLYWASRLLTFYGRNLLGAPKPEDIPEQAGPAYRKRLSKTYFNIWTERVPPTAEQVEKWMIGSLWTTQLRIEQEKRVAQTTFWVSAFLCTALVAAGGLIAKSGEEIESWYSQRKASAQAKAEAQYQAQRGELIKEWTAEAQAYSADECFKQASKFRSASTASQRDQAAAIETGCAGKVDELEELALSWSEGQCRSNATQIADAIEAGRKATWADLVVMQRGCAKRFPEVLREVSERAAKQN